MGKIENAKLVKYAPDNILETVDIPNIRDNADLPIPWPFTKFGKSLDDLLKEKEFNVTEKGFDSEVIGDSSSEKWYVRGVLRRIYENNKKGFEIEYSHIVPLKDDLWIMVDIPGERDKIEWMNNTNFVIGERGFYKLFINDDLGYFKLNVKTKQSDVDVYSEDEFSYIINGMVSKNELSKFLLKKDSDDNIGSDAKYRLDAYPITEENAKKYIFDIITNLALD